MIYTDSILVKIFTDFFEVKTVIGLLADGDNSGVDFKVPRKFSTVSKNPAANPNSRATWALAPIKILGLLVSLPACEKMTSRANYPLPVAFQTTSSSRLDRQGE